MLTTKQRRFVQEYLIDLNAKQAAIRAGYSPRSAEVEGSRLLKHPKVAEALRKGHQMRANATGITPDMVLAELAKIGFSDIRKVVNWRSLSTRVLTDPETGEMVVQGANEVTLVDSATIDDETAAAIAEVSQTKDGALKIKLHDKRPALVDIGKHIGMFKGAVKQAGAAEAPDAPDTSKPADSWDNLLH